MVLVGRTGIAERNYRRMFVNRNPVLSLIATSNGRWHENVSQRVHVSKNSVKRHVISHSVSFQSPTNQSTEAKFFFSRVLPQPRPSFITEQVDTAKSMKSVVVILANWS